MANDMTMKNELSMSWVEKYNPKNLDELVLADEIKSYFKNLLKSKAKFNILLAGHAGIGKTTIAGIMAKELDASVLFVRCGIDGTVVGAQNLVKPFCDSLPMDGKQKMVILDELDSASSNESNSFQKVMRNIINDSADTIFIGTCNYADKIIDPIKSRLGVISLKFSAKDLLFRLKDILDSEGIKYTKESLKDFVEVVIKANYPDIRRIISVLQACCSSGSLIVEEKAVADADCTSFAKEIVDEVSSAHDILEVRKYYLQHKDKIPDYLIFASSLYNYAIDTGAIKTPDGILKLSDIIYQMNVVVDKEAMFFSFIAALSKFMKGN